MEASNKLMLVIYVGQRTQANAYALVHKSVKTLAKGCMPTYASDGLKLYYAALVAYHGQWVADKQLLLRRRMALGSHAAFCAILHSVGLSGRIQNAFIERLNLSLRTGESALIRRSASKVCLELALTRRVEIYRAVYHFVRPHRGLRVTLPDPQPCQNGYCCRRFEPRTPAMAAKLTTSVWSME